MVPRPSAPFLNLVWLPYIQLDCDGTVSCSPGAQQEKKYQFPQNSFVKMTAMDSLFPDKYI